MTRAERFEKEVGPHMAGMYRMACRFCRNSDLADDIYASAIAKAWVKFEQHDPSRARLFTWLCHIVRSEFLDQRKKWSRTAEQTIYIEDMDRASEIPSPDDYEAQVLASVEVSEIKRQMAERLTDRQIEAVIEYVTEEEVSLRRRQANHSAIEWARKKFRDIAA